MKTFDKIYDELQNADNIELNSAWHEAKKESERNKKIAGIICLIIDILFIIMFFKNVINFDSIFLIFYIMFALMINVITFITVVAITEASKKRRLFNEKY